MEFTPDRYFAFKLQPEFESGMRARLLSWDFDPLSLSIDEALCHVVYMLQHLRLDMLFRVEMRALTNLVWYEFRTLIETRVRVSSDGLFNFLHPCHHVYH